MISIIEGLPPERWQEYKALRLASLHDTPQAFLDMPAQAESMEPSVWQERAQNMFFAEDDGTLVGMVGGLRFDRQKQQHIVHLVSMYVLPEYRGQKVGKKLFAAVIEKWTNTPGIKKIKLGVITTQEAALALYKKFGFEVIGTEKYAVKVGDRFYDEFLLEKYL